MRSPWAILELWVDLYFSDVFGVDPDLIESYGAFNISLVNDLPLFIDPFLLFNSPDPTYQELHRGILRYVGFLRDQAARVTIDDGLPEDLSHAPSKRPWPRAWPTSSWHIMAWIQESAAFPISPPGRRIGRSSSRP